MRVPFIIFAVAFAAVFACEAKAVDQTRIGILDLGLGAGSGRGEFGCPSDPAVFANALAPLGETFILHGEDVARDDVLSRRRMDLLVVPTGSAWPAEAADTLVKYLSEGGSLLTCGGYAFDRPVRFNKGSWRPCDPTELPPASDPVVLPPVAKWSVSMPKGEKGSVADGADGGVELTTDKFLLWCTAGAVIKGKLAGKSVISCKVRSRYGARKVRLELDETDNSRWVCDFIVGKDWREIRAVPCRFRLYQGPDGRKDDIVSFDRVKTFSVGCAPWQALAGAPLSVEFADMRCGIDPDAELRCVPIPHINTRIAPVDDALRALPTQVNAFDPSFELLNVARISTGPGTAPGLPQLEIDGAFTGFAAVAQLGVNGHGCSPNRCSLRPILAATAADGSDRGPAAAFVHHFNGTFRGSSWAIFGIDNADLFAQGASGDFLRAVAGRLLRRTALNSTTTSYDCYRVGETAVLKTAVGNFGKEAFNGKVRFTLRDDAGKAFAVREVAVAAPAGANTPVSAKLPVDASTPDYVEFSAELLDANGAAVDRDYDAFVVWNDKVIAKGPRLTIDGTHFALDGRPGFWAGAQTFWAQMAPTTARSPLVFNRDFRQMRAAGLRFTRLFFPWRNEEDRRFSDACVQLAQKHGLVLYHTQQRVEVGVEGEALAAQNAVFREVAARYRAVPGFMVDIRNEPRIKAPPSWESARQMRSWLDSNRAAARESRPGTPVSVGWNQGWFGGDLSIDPALSALDLDFTDRHYYQEVTRMYRDLKDVDMRALGKPMILGECGAKCHPTFLAVGRQGETEEVFANRFRSLAAYVWGLGGTAILAWHWRDPPEGAFPCGLVYGTGVPRLAESVFSKMARTLGDMEPADNPPDVAILLREDPRMRNEGRTEFLEKAYAVDEALLHWGANWSKITESAIDRCKVKLVLDPDALPTGDKAALCREVGRRLRAAGCTFARREGDAEGLKVFRVPGRDAVAWLFLNESDEPLGAVRAGRRVTVRPGRAMYIRVSSAGKVDVCEEL